MIKVERCTSWQQWNNEVLDRQGHPLQLWGWGEVKSKGNWRAERVLIYEDDACIGASQILLRPLPWPFRALAYIPRGPVVEVAKRAVVLEALKNYVRQKRGALSLMVEPDWTEFPILAGWRQSPNPILMTRTVVLDLTNSEDDLQAAMAKKTRQYIRKAERAGVEVVMARDSDDIATCYQIYQQTAQRAGFSLHKESYYQDIFELLGSHSQVFMAKHEGRVVAFLWLAVSGDVAFELYGGINDEGQSARANYFLKWMAIQRTKEWGITRYDMNGLLNDGVSKFKQGFANHETQLAGSYDRPLSIWYWPWARGLPAAKKLIRLVKR